MFGRVILIAVVLSMGIAGAQQPGSLKATLAALDASSAKFTSAQASFQKDLYTAVVRDHDMQQGITYAERRNGAVVEVGIRINGNGARTVLYKNNVAKDYTPGIDCYNSYAAGGSKGMVDSLLALSFGASGKELAANWDVSDLGPDTVNGTTVEKLDLVPKTQGLKNNIKHVLLWADLATAISLKQEVFAPNGDTTTVTLAAVERNKPVEKGQFDIKGKPCGK